MRSIFTFCISDRLRTRLPEPICNVTAPFDIYRTLEQAQLIPPLFQDENLDKVRWIADTDWVATTAVPCALHSLTTASVLTVSGVVGETDVFINDTLAATIASKFLSTEISVHACDQLKFVFKAPVQSARDRKTSEVPECPPESHHGFCGFQYLRRPARDFGWDFAPAVPTVGIEAIMLIREVPVRVAVVPVDEKALTEWRLKVVAGNIFKGDRVSLTRDDEVLIDTEIVSDGRFEWVVQNPALWWPLGTGGHPNLYTLAVGRTVRHKIGFRKIKLVQIEDEYGRSFRFTVNNLPVYIRGVNAVVEPDEFILNLLAENNFSLIRMWGGGDYGSEAFYRQSDELGILVWEEFKFACATYPKDADFLALVEREVAQQTERISNHPSIAVFSGNNEVAQAIVQNWYNDTRAEELLEKNYRQLFMDTVMRTFENNNFNHVDFVLTSPSPGRETQEHPLPESLNTEKSGDMHFYDYTSDCWDVKTHPRSRFMSEFGFQSLPHISTLVAAVSDPTILGGTFSDNAFLVHRQHRQTGNQEITASVGRHFRVDPAALTVDNACYLSQITHGVCLRKLVESFSRDPGNDGFVIWQLNDVWPTISWSLVDFSGVPKFAFYFASAVDGQSLWVQDETLFVKTERSGTLFTSSLGSSSVGVQFPFSGGLSHWPLRTLCEAGCEDTVAYLDDMNYTLLGHVTSTDENSHVFVVVRDNSVDVITDRFHVFVMLHCENVVFTTNGFLLEPFKAKRVHVRRGRLTRGCVSYRTV